ncbi:MAG TPA: MscL family protein [Candidatus Woesebacteria bacterium]|nr:MscL family protein [Candidatus Woesebacteria bacterium]
MKKFINFIREQGVVGLAIGFILGGAVSKLVSSLVNDIVNPVLSVFLGFTDVLKDSYFQIGNVKILWGNFLNNFVDFLILSFVVYILVKIIGLDRLDKKKDKK